MLMKYPTITELNTNIVVIPLFLLIFNAVIKNKAEIAIGIPHAPIET